MRRWQVVAPVVGVARGVIGDQHAGDGLLLEPLAGVPGVDAGVGSKLGGGGRADPGQCGVEAQPQAQPDAEGLHCCRKICDEAVGQRLALLAGVVSGLVTSVLQGVAPHSGCAGQRPEDSCLRHSHLALTGTSLSPASALPADGSLRRGAG